MENRSFLPMSWEKVGLAILPGLFIASVRSGLFRQVLGWKIQRALEQNDLIPVYIALGIVLAGFILARRLAAWSFPALGILIGIASLLALSLGPLLLLAVLAAIVALVVCQWRGLNIPRLGWVLLCLMILVSVVDGVVSTIADRAPDKWIGFWTFLAFCLVWGCVVLLPIAIGLPLARRSGLLAGVAVVAAEFVLVDGIFDPAYALGLWTSNQTIVKVVSVIPAVFFLVVSVIWVLRSRSTRGQVCGLLLPAFIALVSAEVIGGTVRPYYSIDTWLTRGIGAAQFLIAIALAAVIYHWIERQGQAAANAQKDRGALADRPTTATAQNTA